MREVKEEERTVQVGISFTRELLKTIDKLRGRESRSLFVRRMVRGAIIERDLGG